MEEGDYDGLVNIITILQQVRDRQSEYDGMFETLTSKLNLLKVYDVEIPEDVYSLMDVKTIIND